MRYCTGTPAPVSSWAISLRPEQRRKSSCRWSSNTSWHAADLTGCTRRSIRFGIGAIGERQGTHLESKKIGQKCHLQLNRRPSASGFSPTLGFLESLCDRGPRPTTISYSSPQTNTLNLRGNRATCLTINLKSCGYCLRPTAQIFLRAKPTRAFMNNQEPDLNPTPAETDSAKPIESVQREGSELPVDQRSSYLRSRQIALKKFSPQGGDPS